MNQLESQTLALAGMFQAAVLIEELAQQGQCQGTAYDCSLDSLFTFDVATPRDVFGDIYCLRRGFEAIGAYLGGQSRDDGRNIAYYVLSMLKLGNRVLRDDTLGQALQQGLQNIERDVDEFDMPRASMNSKIDGLYQREISQLTPQVMVRGEERHLRDTDIAARIRTLLLAGIRAAVLWRQLGGSKWRLFIGRKRYLAASRKFLSYH